MTMTMMKKTKNLKTRLGIFKNMGGNIPGGNFLGGNFLGGNFPGGNFPRTVYINRFIFNCSMVCIVVFIHCHLIYQYTHFRC